MRGQPLRTNGMAGLPKFEQAGFRQELTWISPKTPGIRGIPDVAFRPCPAILPYEDFFAIQRKARTAVSGRPACHSRQCFGPVLLKTTSYPNGWPSLPSVNNRRSLTIRGYAQSALQRWRMRHIFRNRFGRFRKRAPPFFSSVDGSYHRDSQLAWLRWSPHHKKN